jgi:chorismate-pyruvate lyase
MNQASNLNRRRFVHGLQAGSATAIWAQSLLNILIAQDGSATLLCDTLAGQAVQLTVLQQGVTTHVPAEVKANLPGELFLERLVTLSSGGEVMMDNLSFIALDAIEPGVQAILEEGQLPIGHLFNQLWVRKTNLAGMQALHARLWAHSGLPDPDAVRSYRVNTPSAPCMLITETFRFGMRMNLPALGIELPQLGNQVAEPTAATARCFAEPIASEV